MTTDHNTNYPSGVLRLRLGFGCVSSPLGHWHNHSAFWSSCPLHHHSLSKGRCTIQHQSRICQCLGSREDDNLHAHPPHRSGPDTEQSDCTHDRQHWCPVFVVDAGAPTRRRTRHVDIRYYFALLEWSDSGQIKAEAIPTDMNISSDSLTKATGRIKFHQHANIYMGRVPPHYVPPEQLTPAMVTATLTRFFHMTSC